MITPEKKHKIIFFFGKKMRPKSVVSQSRKILQLLKKNFFKKKFLPAYLSRYGLQNGVRDFFLLNKWVSRYLRFGALKVPKDCSSQ